MNKLTVMLAAMALTVACGGSERGPVRPPSEAPSTGTTQINDVFIDEREVVYCVDRHVGGLYCLEMDF